MIWTFMYPKLEQISQAISIVCYYRLEFAILDSQAEETSEIV